MAIKLPTQKPGGFQLDLNDPEMLGRIATNLGISPQQPQANLLERVLGVLRGIGSLPDAYKDALTNRSNVLEEYMKNIGGGLSTTFLGTKPEEDFATSSDILKDWGILAGEDMGSKIGRGVLGFAGDVLLDPSTYVSFGAAGLGKKIGQEALEAGAKAAAPTALKVFGKQVTTNPLAVGTAKAVFNPLGEIVKGAGKVAMKTEMGQEVAKGLAKAFDEDAYVKLLEKENPGISKVLDLVRKKSRLISGGDAWTIEANTSLRKALDKLPDNMKNIFARVIEAKPGDIETLISQNMITPELMPLVKQVAKSNSAVEDALVKTGILAKETVGTRGDKLFNDFNNALKKARIAITKQTKDPKQAARILGDTGTMGEFNPFINFLKQATGNADKSYVNNLKTLGGFKAKAEDLPILAKKVLDTFGDKIPNTSYAPFRDELAQLATKVPERLGVPYFARDVLSFSQDYIKNKFGVDADFILNEPSVIKELNNPNIAGVTKETLGKVLNKNPQFLKAKGIVDPVKFLEDAANERTFQYLADGEAAGIRYSKDIGRLFMTGQVRANRALIEDAIVQELRNLTEDGQKLLLTKGEAEGFWGKIPATWKTKTFKTGTLNELEGETILAAPREVMDIVNNNLGNFAGDESVSNFMKLYDKGMSVFKASVTSRGPGFIGYNLRNAVGDMVNMVAGGFRNQGLDDSNAFFEAKKFMDFRKALETLGEEGAIRKYGEKMAIKYRNILNSGILSSSQITEALGGRADEILAKGKPTKAIDRALKALDVATFKDPARYREDLFRVANLIDNVSRAGGSWEEGARLARLSSLDYNALTSFEKGTMKRIIPFYSFMRQNMKFHLDNFQKNPGVYSGYMHVMDGIKNIMESEGATAEDYAALPDWMKKGFAVVTGKAGGLASVLTQTGDPIEALNDLNPMNIAASGISPMLRAPIEYLTQRNLFTGETFDSPSARSGARYKDMPDAIKKFLKYREVKRKSKDGKEYTDYTVDPVRAKILGDLPIVSPLMTTGKRFTEATKDPTMQKLLTLLTGTKFYDVNLEREMTAREKEQLERIKRALVYEGYGKESPPRFYFPQEEKSNLQSLLK